MEQREILFKAKSLYSDKWLKGDLVHAPLGTRIEWWENNALLVEDIDPSTVCQFTGLKDKDGKEVWEGDLVDYYNSIGEVFYKEGVFQVKFPDYKCALKTILKEGYTKFHTIVIGNKFDRKEEKCQH